MNDERASRQDRSGQYSLAALLLGLTALSFPLAVFRSGAVLSAFCLLYAAVVFPIFWDLCRRKAEALERYAPRVGKERR